MRTTLDIFPYITPSKAVNLLQLWTSFHLSRILRKPIIMGRPMALSIEPTTSCNLRCPECPSGLRSFSRPTGMLSLNAYRSMVDKVSRNLIYLNLYFQGEPYLNPDFFKMVRYAREKKIYTATSTNGHFLDDHRAKATIRSGLNRIIISVDGADQQTYADYRVGGQLEKVKEGIRNLVKYRDKLGSKDPFIILQVLVFRSNEKQLDEIRQLGKSMGVDAVTFKTAQIYDLKNGAERIPSDPQYSRYRKVKEGNYSIKNGLPNHCWRMWSSGVVTWDGNMVPCCFDKDASHMMGNLVNDPLDELWQGRNYQVFRSKLNRSRDKIGICTNCSEGSRVWV